MAKVLSKYEHISWRRATLLLLLACFMCCRRADRQDMRKIVEEQRKDRSIEELYGVRMSDYKVDTVQVPASSSLSTLLSAAGVSEHYIAQLQGAVGGVFSVRRIRADRPSYFFRIRDSVRYWVYSHTPRVYLKLHFAGDSVRAELDTLQVSRRVARAYVRIKSLLWNGMRDVGDLWS